MSKVQEQLGAAAAVAAEDVRRLEAAGVAAVDSQARMAQLAALEDDVRRRFARYNVDNHAWMLEQVRAEVRALGLQLAVLVPPGRELSLVLTKLEEVMFFANAGIARAKGVAVPEAGL